MSSSSKINNNSRRRQIKGGGRAVMSRESQEAVIDLLMRLSSSSSSSSSSSKTCDNDSNSNNNNNNNNDNDEPNANEKALSAHERKRQKAKFVKRLVKDYEQKQWRAKLRGNSNKEDESTTTATTTAVAVAAANPLSDTTKNPAAAAAAASKKDATTKNKTKANANEKVRIELVEAIFKDASSKQDSKDKDKDKKKSSKKSSSNSNSSKFKEGAKKVVVVPRATTRNEILSKLAPAKLRLKTKPVRVFLKASKTTLVELAETDDLSGLDDGTALYVTATPARGRNEGGKSGGADGQKSNDNDKTKHKHKTNDNDNDNDNDADQSPIEAAVDDPLDSVKRAYDRQRDHRRAMRKRERTSGIGGRKKNNSNSNASSRAPHDASKHAASRASLPAAAYREPILSAVRSNSVVVLCGATGCGKSTQVPQFLVEEEERKTDPGALPLASAVASASASASPDALLPQSPTATTGTKRRRNKYVVVTQPRRVAATSLANRVAEERGSPPPGEPWSTVGCLVRSDRRIDETSCEIVYMTVGILLRMLVSESSSSSSSSSGIRENNSKNKNNNNNNNNNNDEDDDDDRDGSKPLPLTIENISHIVIDEVHERDVNTDFVLTLLKGLLFSPASPLKHLKLILMSATAASDLFVRYFTPKPTRATPNPIPPVVLEIPGRTFPVAVRWLPECERVAGTRLKRSNNNSSSETETEDTDSSNGGGGGGGGSSPLPRLSPRARDTIDNQFIRALIAKIVQKQQSDGELEALPESRDTNNNNNNNNKIKTNDYRTTGAILVFLPGQGEIEALAACLSDPGTILGNKNVCSVLRLHSSVPRTEQDRVFRRARTGTVKIVLATNIAETSLTIPDVSHVVDACLVKEARYNAAKRIPELVTVWTSSASLQQRAGRAGRTSAGTCWRLCSEDFCKERLLAQTAPEMLRTPLDELVLQIGLLYEQRRDDHLRRIAEKAGTGGTITTTTTTTTSSSNKNNGGGGFAPGAQPIKFLSMTPSPPPRASLIQACKHLLEVEALEVVHQPEDGGNGNGNTEDTWSYRLTPLGYHLSRLPMDAKVGKVLIVGCILGCLDGALTIAAALSCTKSCFFSKPSREHVHAREVLVENGFGGAGWPGGTAKGDLIAAVATYRAWTQKTTESQRWKFCRHHALDYATLRDMDRLRGQFRGLLADAGFVARSQKPPNRSSNNNNKSNNDDGNGNGDGDDWCHRARDDALLTSCCLVAGLYPNICSLIRPRKGGPRGGRLYTNDGDECLPQSNSFQRKRVREAAQTGKDAYAVYHAKHRTLGTNHANNHQKQGASEIFLTEVNFVSRFALLLFGGDLEIVQNAIVVDGWLKFKVSSESSTSDGEKNSKTPRADTVNNAFLILALREQLDQMILERVVSESSADGDPGETRRTKERHENVIRVVRKLLSEEG